MTTTKLVTADELFQMADDVDGTRTELVRGVLVKTMPPGEEHSDLTGIIYLLVQSFLREHPLGRAYVELGCILARDPDIVRAPDVAFVRAERLRTGDRSGYLPYAPDLTVEIVSPGDRAGAIADKVSDYLDAGVRLVWVVYPRQRSVVVHRPDGASRTLRSTETLDGEDVLPGFRLALAELFR